MNKETFLDDADDNSPMCQYAASTNNKARITLITGISICPNNNTALSATGQDFPITMFQIFCHLNMVQSSVQCMRLSSCDPNRTFVFGCTQGLG